jgi:cytosine/adenosine deaminase-related metal-dependent hydrolase
MTILIRNAAAVVTGDAQATVLHNVDVLVQEDTIVDIGAGLEAPEADVIDATGAIVAAGLIDSHMHMWEYGWRMTLQRKEGRYKYEDLFWPLRPLYTPEDTLESTYGCGIEMLDHGITGVFDFFHGANSTPEHADAAIEAHKATGQRVVLGYGATGAYGMDQEAFEVTRQARVADFERLRKANTEAPLIDVGLALITPLPKNWPGFMEELAHARSLGAMMSFHANTAGEFTRLAQAGVLGPDIVPSHGNCASQPELKALAEAGTIISITPSTETASGKSLGVVDRGIPFGVKFAIGIDTPPSISPLNLFTQAKLLFNYLRIFDGIRLREGNRFPQDFAVDPPTAALDAVWQMATEYGAQTLGLGGKLGTIEVGKLADIIVVRPHDADATLEDPTWYLVQGQPGKQEVETVIVNGVVKKRDGAMVGIDAQALRERNRVHRGKILGYVNYA